MKITTFSLLLFTALLAHAQSDPVSRSWNQPIPPFRIEGNLFYVGASDITSYLITTADGHILLDGGFVETAPIIRANIERLGFRVEDVKILIGSHAHYDHAGGVAELKRITNAQFVSSALEAPLYAAGGKGDPQFGDRFPFPPIVADRTIADGEQVTLGGVTLTAHITAGHTRGCTTWTTGDAVFLCSPSVPSDYKLVGNTQYPTVVEDYRRQFAFLRSLKPRLFLASHGNFFDLENKRKTNAFADPAGYRAFVEEKEQQFERIAAQQSAKNDVGEVAFANSGKPEAQAAFLRGLGLLHNFEYPRAAMAFQEAQKIDPSFAMAYWGEAMTHTHPIWFQQDREAARAILQRLGATPEERLAKAPTEREKDYLRALDVLYGEGSKNARDFLYADAMAALHAKYPNDVDATAFYALAILGTAHEGRDFDIYMRAAAVLEEVFPANPRHPGVLHYLIHAYDDPVHAPLGMRAARVYGSVAPDAGHALHMTSHIFIAMGMWDDVIDANRRAIRVVNRQRAARKAPAVHCGHYPTWLHYGLLQKGQDHDARKALDACRATAFEANAENQRNQLEEFAMMRAHQIASSPALPEREEIAVPKGVSAPVAAVTLAYGDVLAAARHNDANALKVATERLRSLQKAALDAIDEGRAANPTARITAEVQMQEAEALQLILAGKREEALKILEKAAAAERSMPLEFGPPVIPKPATELLADQLLAAGRAADAAKAYEQVLARTPGRRPTLEGLLLAQQAAGNTKAAEDTAKKIAAPHVH